MRVYDQEEFLRQPVGVLFCPVFARIGDVHAWSAGGLRVKNATVGQTSLYWSVNLATIEVGDGTDSSEVIPIMEAMADSALSRPMNTAIDKDCAEAEDLFLVFERNDLLALRDIVNAALEVA